MISRDFIKHRLLPRVDIVKLIDSYCKLKRSGSNYSCLCPFHKEKSPSFMVSPSRQTFMCFGCGAHGSAIDFIEKYKNLNFVETIEELARFAGVDVEYEQGGRERRADDRYQLYYELMDRAASYFTSQLRATPEALSYFKDKRGLSELTIVKGRLGYAPNDYDYAKNKIARNADEYKKLIELGLQVDRYDEDKQRQLTRAFFRNRVMFPIFDIKGRIIAFGGRQLGDYGPKYLNTPETPIFKKRRELFGLYECLKATRNRPEKVVVVEGYMDAIALRQAGFDYVVATLGTAITAEHFNLLFRYTNQVICCFDGDEAGKKATWHALQTVTPVLVDANKEVRFINLPAGHDPDTLVRSQGKEAFEAQIEKSVSYPESIMLHESKLYNVADPSERVRLINSVLAIAKAMKNMALQQVTLQVLSGYVKMPFESISAMCQSAEVKPDQAFMRLEGSHFADEASGRDGFKVYGAQNNSAPDSYKAWGDRNSYRRNYDEGRRTNVPTWASSQQNGPEVIRFTGRPRTNLGAPAPQNPVQLGMQAQPGQFQPAQPGAQMGVPGQAWSGMPAQPGQPAQPWNQMNQANPWAQSGPQVPAPGQLPPGQPNPALAMGQPYGQGMAQPYGQGMAQPYGQGMAQPLAGIKPSISVQSRAPFAPEVSGGVVTLQQLQQQVRSEQIEQNQQSPAGQYLNLGPDGVPRSDNQRVEEPTGEYYEGGRGPGTSNILTSIDADQVAAEAGELAGAGATNHGVITDYFSTVEFERNLGLTLEEVQTYNTVVGVDFTPRDLSSPVYQLIAFILQQPTIVAQVYEQFKLEQFLQLGARLKITEYPCIERLIHLIDGDRNITCAGIIEEYRETDFDPLFSYLMGVNINGSPDNHEEWSIQTQIGFFATYLRKAIAEPLFNRSRSILMNGSNISEDNLKELSALREFNYRQS